MKPLTILSFIVLLTGMVNPCLSQSYSYGYDASGNRTSRVIALPPGLKSTLQEDSLIRKEYRETLEDIEIVIYPNPTEGELTVQLRNYDGSRPSIISVYDFTGRLIQTHSNPAEYNRVNLSGVTRGTYLLRITIGDKRSEWKVVKN